MKGKQVQSCGKEALFIMEGFLIASEIKQSASTFLDTVVLLKLSQK